MTSRITDAVLWIHHPTLMTERLCGMSVLERQLFLLSSVGINRAWIAAREPANAARLRRPARLAVLWIPKDGDAPVECRPPYISFSGDHFVRREALAELLSQGYDNHVSFQDDRRRGVVQVIPFRGERVTRFEKRPMPAGSFAHVPAHASRAAARRWLLDGARKGHDGLMARLFDRTISLAATRWLLDTPLMPNHMTIFSSAIGLVGAFLFARPDHAGAALGAALVWLHSVLDGCDGEMARLRCQESRFGGVLDFWGDNVVHVALFTCLGLGLSRQNGAAWPLALGLLAAAASFASAMLTYRLSAARRAASEGGPFFNGLNMDGPLSSGARLLQRVEDFLTQRDFIYLLVLAALFHRRHLFLIVSAIGAPLFFLILWYLTLQSGARLTKAPEPKAAEPALTPSRGPQ